MRIRKMRRYEGGVTSKSNKFYALFSDHSGSIRVLPLFEDCKASEEVGRKIDRLVDLRAANDTPDAELTRWLETTTSFIREKMAEYGIIAQTRFAQRKPLVAHIDEWKDALIAKGNTPSHAVLVTSRARTAFAKCGFDHWTDIAASKLQTQLHDLRQGHKGISAQTYNFYLQAVKQFAKWMVQDGRASHSPLAHLTGVNVKTERRHDRRAFTVEEFRWFLATTETRKYRDNMSGRERSLLYLLAVETGFRRGELTSLTHQSFELGTDEPRVTVTANNAKARKERSAPLRPEVAAMFRKHLAGKMPGAPTFSRPGKNAAIMIRVDLRAARAAWLKSAADDETRASWEASNFLQYKDDRGRFLDFHALRHTRGVWLFEHYKAHPREVQELMGVSSLSLVDRYTQTFKLTDLGFLNRAPDLSRPNSTAPALTQSPDAAKVG